MSDYTPFPQHFWDPAIKRLIDAETYYVSQTWSRFVSLPPPPADSQEECDAVVEAGEDRVECKDDILEQAESLQQQLWPIIDALNLPRVTQQNWAPPRVAAAGDPILPKTWELLRAGLWDMQCGLYILKRRFNRGRPVHTFGSAVGVTTVTTPGHPAYPGGHAAQCHAAVLLLEAAIKRTSKKDELPALMGDMLSAAESVARNRVVAGIHFPSDTEAGRLLALQYVPMLLRSPLFAGVLAAAVEEIRLM